MSVVPISARLSNPPSAASTISAPTIPAPTQPRAPGVILELRASVATGGAVDNQTSSSFTGADPSAALRAAGDGGAPEAPAGSDGEAVRTEASQRLAATLAATSGSQPQNGAEPRSAGTERPRVHWSPKAEGTPVDAPATRAEFSHASDAAAAGASDHRDAAARKQWRVVEVVSALSGPAAARLIAAADRPGPVEPGSLLEAVKVFRRVIPAPPPSTNAVV